MDKVTLVFLGGVILSIALFAWVMKFCVREFVKEWQDYKQEKILHRAYEKKMALQFGKMTAGWLKGDAVAVSMAIHTVQHLDPTLGRHAEMHMRRSPRVGTGTRWASVE